MHSTVSDAKLFDHLHRVGRGAADIGLGLHIGGGVDIGHHRHAGIALASSRTSAPVIESDSEHPAFMSGISTVLSMIEQLRGLGHEMDAALDDDLGVDLGRLLGELQRVADDIGDAVKDFRRLVVVRQDNGVALLLHAVDGGT
jgi:hypothetical protein